MRDNLVFTNDIDKSVYESAFFTEQSIEERIVRDRRNKLRFQRVLVIASHFLLSRERRVFEIYVYHNRNISDLLCFVKSQEKYLVIHKVKKIFSLLRKFVEFFDENPYKKIDRIVQEILLPRQYELLKLYLRMHHYRRCGLAYGVTEQTIQSRVEMIKKRLIKREECQSLVDLILFLQNYKYEEKRKKISKQTNCS